MENDEKQEEPELFNEKVTNPHIEKFDYFLNLKYSKEIEKLNEKERILKIDYKTLEEYDPYLADEVAKKPDICLDAIKYCINKRLSIVSEKHDFDPLISIHNLPTEQRILVKHLGAEHIDTLVGVEGIVRQFTTILPKLKVAHWMCKRCGYEFDMDVKHEIEKPTICPECRHKALDLIEPKSIFIDYQKLEIQEPLEVLKGGEQSATLVVTVTEDLVGKVSAGDRIIITGILRLVPPQKKQSIYGRYLDCLDIEETKQDYENIDVTNEELEQIKAYAENPEIYNILVNSIAPNIHGHDVIKESIAMQLFGGVKKTLEDGSKTRGNIHILLIGDPGVGKSKMLLYTSNVAPKSLYVVGKTASGAGLTASAVKDEFGEGGWTLKAGALVLASGGFAMIDEFDKMDPEDRSAMHEAMEQESYHKDFEIMLSDGTKHKIGELVDTLIERNKSKVMQGKDCEILKSNNLSVLTTDFKKLFSIKADRISRHVAPKEFIEITYSNGRKIIVTPNHPIFTFENNNFTEKPAEEVKTGMFCPYTTITNLTTKKVILDSKEIKTGKKEIAFPKTITPKLGALLGYILTEGHIYLDKSNHYAEIGVSNTDPQILDKVKKAFSKSFSSYLNINIQKAEKRAKATKDLTTIRCCSLPLYKFFEKNFKELIAKSVEKRIPKKIFICSEKIKRAFLSAAFEGDGFVDSERFGFITASKLMAEDYQDILLQLGLFTRIQTEVREDRKYYKIVVVGYNSKKKFLKLIPESDKRLKKIKTLIEKSKGVSGQRELVPQEILKQVDRLQKELQLSKGYFFAPLKKGHNAEKQTIIKNINIIKEKLNTLKKGVAHNPRILRKAFCIELKDVAKEMNISTSQVTYIERTKQKQAYNKLYETVKNISTKKVKNIEKEVFTLDNVLNSKIGFVSITQIKKIPNKDSKWVYDITVEPTRTFITGGFVLHNTVSVAKAGIVSNFKTETSILAAANPKFGRFDMYKTIPEQIDIPPALLSRFDLFFSLKDIVDDKKDKETVMSILKGHKTGELLSKMKQSDLSKRDREYLDKSSKPQIPPDIFKKYISYARTKVFPTLSDKAMDRLGKFFIELRKKSKDGRVTVTYRQLEALIRLSEGSARARLSQSVEIEDAERAIRLFRTSMEQVGLDPETGDMDIDIITTGQSHSQAVQMRGVLEIIKDWCKEHDTISLNELVVEAEARKIDKGRVQDFVGKLSRAGDIYEPKPLHYKPVFKD